MGPREGPRCGTLSALAQRGGAARDRGRLYPAQPLGAGVGPGALAQRDCAAGGAMGWGPVRGLVVELSARWPKGMARRETEGGCTLPSPRGAGVGPGTLAQRDRAAGGAIGPVRASPEG